MYRQVGNVYSEVGALAAASNEVRKGKNASAVRVGNRGKNAIAKKKNHPSCGKALS